MQQAFVLEYWEDNGWLVGRLKGVPGAFSQGATLEELEENIRDAYQLMLRDEEAAPLGAQTKGLAIEVESVGVELSGRVRRSFHTR